MHLTGALEGQVTTDSNLLESIRSPGDRHCPPEPPLGRTVGERGQQATLLGGQVLHRLNQVETKVITQTEAATATIVPTRRSVEIR